jgi:hypothetical protein
MMQTYKRQHYKYNPQYNEAVINMTLKQNLMARSTEIKFLVEKELRILEVPCSIADLVKRVDASRMPVENRLKFLLTQPDFADIHIARIGGVDVIYRKPTLPLPKVNPPALSKLTESEISSHTATAPSQDAPGPDNKEVD